MTYQERASLEDVHLTLFTTYAMLFGIFYIYRGKEENVWFRKAGLLHGWPFLCALEA